MAESMCDRIARHKGCGTLPLKFWKNPEWERVFRFQLTAANRLMKDFSPQAVIRALRTPQGHKTYSLGAKWLRALIEREQKALDAAEARREATPQPAQPPPPTNEKPREGFVVKPSQLSQLRSLD